MSQQRRGLGRGLGALIPTAPPVSRETGMGQSTGDSGTAAREAAAKTRAGGTSGDSDATSSRHDHRSGESSGGPGAHGNGARGESAREAGAGGDGVSGDGVSGGSNSGDAVMPTATQGASATDEAALVPVGGAYFAEVLIDKIQPNPRQPREVFDDDEMAELVHSIKEVGLLQPVVVRPVDDGVYELVMGERRWRATKEAGKAVIPAIVRETSDADLLRDALLENLHRAALNPLEEAAAYQQLLDDFGCTHDELAQRIGRSRPQISNTVRLLRLSPAVQRRVAAGVLSAGHARALVAVQDAQRQDRLAQRVVAEGLSVRALEELVALGEELNAPDEPKQRPRRAVAPKLADLADRLADRFETRVKVDLGKKKGKITVEFASIDDLERIVTLMDPAAQAAEEHNG